MSELELILLALEDEGCKYPSIEEIDENEFNRLEESLDAYLY